MGNAVSDRGRITAPPHWRVDVDALVVALRAEHLGRHVLRRARGELARRELARARGEPEVGDQFPFRNAAQAPLEARLSRLTHAPPIQRQRNARRRRPAHAGYAQGARHWDRALGEKVDAIKRD